MKIKEIRFRSYGNYSSDNYGAHSLEFTIGDNHYYFSYDTLVAFRSLKHGLVCRKNEWGTTTGKHLNIICPDKSRRVDEATFEKLLSEI